MAIIHQATLSPSKLDVLSKYIAAWPALSEHVGSDLEQVGAYRFDDPAGQVGIETHILKTTDGSHLQVPLVYRNDEMPEAADWFVGTMEHSVLGTRWVYDACFDAIYLNELVRVILTGDVEAAEIVETPEGKVPRATTVQVRGSGESEASIEVSPDVSPVRSDAQTVVDVGEFVVMIPHVLEEGVPTTELSLSGVWAGRGEAITLARMVRSG